MGARGGAELEGIEGCISGILGVAQGGKEREGAGGRGREGTTDWRGGLGFGDGDGGARDWEEMQESN